VLTGNVTFVRDGDTIEVAHLPVRLNGLATPEGDEPGGSATTRALRGMVLGRIVRCELDGERTHDRCVAVCYLDGMDRAAEMVRAGLARDCPRFSHGRYQAAEAQAAAAGATIGESYRLPDYCRRRRGAIIASRRIGAACAASPTRPGTASKIEPGSRSPVQNALDDVRDEEREPQDAAHVAPPDASTSASSASVP
jgi:micrococcal nuclease